MNYRMKHTKTTALLLALLLLPLSPLAFARGGLVAGKIAINTTQGSNHEQAVCIPVKTSDGKIVQALIRIPKGKKLEDLYRYIAEEDCFVAKPAGNEDKSAQGTPPMNRTDKTDTNDSTNSTPRRNRQDAETVVAGARIVMTGRVVADQPTTISVVNAQGQTLSGVVVSAGDEQVRTDENGAATLNVNASAINEDGNDKLFVASIAGARAAAVVLPNVLSPSSRPVIEHIEPFTTLGGDLTITGTGYAPIASTNVVRINQQTVPIRAASPVELKVSTPPDLPVGRQSVEVINSRGFTSATTNLLRLSLTATNTTLHTEQKAQVNCRVEGFADLPPEAFPVAFEMTNESPSKIAFPGEASQRISLWITHSDLQADGSFNYMVPIRALAPGNFRISARVTPVKQDAEEQDAKKEDCDELLKKANQKRDEANKKREEAAKLRKEAEELRNGADHYKNRAKRMRELSDDAKAAAKRAREQRDKDWSKPGPKLPKESYDKKIAQLERDAEDYAAKAKEANETADRLEKTAPKSQKERDKQAENKEQQAKNADQQADDKEKEARQLEKDYKDCLKKQKK